MQCVGALEMAKSTYVAASQEGLVPLTIYVKHETRQALKLAALKHEMLISDIMAEAIVQVLKKYSAKS